MCRVRGPHHLSYEINSICRAMVRSLRADRSTSLLCTDLRSRLCCTFVSALATGHSRMNTARNLLACFRRGRCSRTQNKANATGCQLLRPPRRNVTGSARGRVFRYPAFLPVLAAMSDMNLSLRPFVRRPRLLTVSLPSTETAVGRRFSLPVLRTLPCAVGQAPLGRRLT